MNTGSLFNLNVKPEDPEKILKQLLEYVQKCQRRYGGKHELATEYDACVAGLCLCLEAVFLHGLKNTNQNTLKQVSEIVAQSLNIKQESLAFWIFIEKHLTKHERERFQILKNIWTDIGKCKAWIRSALNEKSLERYFHTILSDLNILNEHYEVWALLRDDDRNSMLPNMAAGLGSILFAISIDKVEFNAPLTLRPKAVAYQEEPIIEVPIPKNTKKNNKKVARQVISFDDDDSLLSGSVMSMSSSSSDGSHVKEEERKVMRRVPMGGRSMDTRMAEVGEVIPISVERGVVSELIDESIEVPTDISAVLEVVENKNKEEVKSRDDKIELLSRENDSLKEQVKKYVSAIQLLRRDDTSIKKVLEELEIEKMPDYSSEVRDYEQKLIQVAEMHAELMDFNVMLQKSLSEKDQRLDRLNNELERLQQPLVTMSCVSVWIPSAFLTGTGSDAHHVYQIFLKAGNDEWNIYRRYAQFYDLHNDLKKLDPLVKNFNFPPKKSIGKKDSAIVEDRRQRLQYYLRKVIAHWPELSHCNNRFLLEQHMVFFKEQQEDELKRTLFTTTRPMNEAGNHSGL